MRSRERKAWAENAKAAAAVAAQLKVASTRASSEAERAAFERLAGSFDQRVAATFAYIK